MRGCVIWPGGTCSGGRYGGIWRDGKWQPAHRVAYADAHGPIPDGFHVHHKCGVKLCVNLEHLELLEAGEHHRQHKRKVTDEQVREIRRAPKRYGVVRELARALGLNEATVSKIRRDLSLFPGVR